MAGFVTGVTDAADNYEMRCVIFRFYNSNKYTLIHILKLLFYFYVYIPTENKMNEWMNQQNEKRSGTCSSCCC